MNNKKYIPVQFCRDWLPDWSIRHQKQVMLWTDGDKSINDSELLNSLANEDLVRKHFQEALENFAKAQREECLKNAKLIDVTIVEPYTMTSSDSNEVIYGHNKINTKGLDEDSILNAPMPEPIKIE